MRSSFRLDHTCPHDGTAAAAPGSPCGSHRLDVGFLPENTGPVLDLIPTPLGFFDRTGVLRFANTALRGILSSAGRPDRVTATLTAAIRAANDERTIPRSAEVRTTVRLGMDEYRLYARRIEGEIPGMRGSVVVSLQRIHAAAVTLPLLRKKHGLTPQEIRVALLLADGLSNSAVAAELYISQHTARHHTARVLEKLEARSRTEVGRILRGLAVEAGGA